VMPSHGNDPKKLQSYFFWLVVGTLTWNTVTGVCYESICSASKTRNGGIKR
jgi:hypothetical protein